MENTYHITYYFFTAKDGKRYFAAGNSMEEARQLIETNYWISLNGAKYEADDGTSGIVQ